MKLGAGQFDVAVREFKRELIVRTMEEWNNHRGMAARALGIHTNTLARYIEEFDLLDQFPPIPGNLKERRLKNDAISRV